MKKPSLFYLVVITLVLIVRTPAVPQEKPSPQEERKRTAVVLTYPDYDNLSGVELIEMVQRALKSEGFDPGPIDGIFGPQTRSAIEAFQNAHGLPPTGQIDDRTRNLLFWSF